MMCECGHDLQLDHDPCGCLYFYPAPSYSTSGQFCPCIIVPSELGSPIETPSESNENPAA